MIHSTSIERPSRQARLAWLVRVGIALLLSGPLGGSVVRADESNRIVVLTSRDDGPYERVVSGVRSTLRGEVNRGEIRVHSLQEDSDLSIEAVKAARATAQRPVITVGSSATRIALEAPGDAPVIACMVVDAQDIEKEQNATGVVLEFPIETQLRWIRHFVPDSHAIGILYNPDENAERIAAAERAADELGLRLVARAVERPQDLPAALDSLTREADLLLAITDRIVLSRQTTQAILLFSFRNRMPFSGLSSSWVKAGALYALERDYEDMGAQCGEMAIDVLRGKRASTIEPAAPRKVVYTINVRTAEQLRLRLPPELVSNAAEVYR